MYSTWKSQQSPFLWLHGISGCGKTILSSTIIEDLERESLSERPLYFYFDFSDAAKRTFENMLRSLIVQSSQINASAKARLQTLYKQHQDGTKQLCREALEKTLAEMISTRPDTAIVLDALDECTSREPLLKWVRSVSCRILLTSKRPEDLSSSLESWLDQKSIFDMQRSEVEDDIEAYVRHQLRDHESKLAETWASRPDILDKIEETIKEQAKGM